MFGKRITAIVGHFGSGKTEIAVNGALKLAGDGVPVALVDLDVVKPYFRSRAARGTLAEHGVDLVVPAGDNIFADLPIIVPQIRTLLRDGRRKVLVDVGGDDTGARALGSLADAVPSRRDRSPAGAQLPPPVHRDRRRGGGDDPRDRGRRPAAGHRGHLQHASDG